MKRLMLLLGLLATALVWADDLGYSPDGGLVSFGEFDYVYDSASRLTDVWPNTLTSTALLWHHTHMTHLATPYRKAA